ncbi:hypothetical protein EJ03DRAFT_83015 [Teratosphaeria nubilosa]|uniref:Uncharacterized protein n=1 Tax=Teratosphaeria nubilosa TaxID=161662 RepID=A0A6G1LAW7_9PEZI|nr:hypothetical protein EJ03DRAFT_83015 [Teratosphaeria nubilosa]
MSCRAFGFTTLRSVWSSSTQTSRKPAVVAAFCSSNASVAIVVISLQLEIENCQGQTGARWSEAGQQVGMEDREGCAEYVANVPVPDRVCLPRPRYPGLQLFQQLLEEYRGDTLGRRSTTLPPQDMTIRMAIKSR